jgi:hypothetical protein
MAQSHLSLVDLASINIHQTSDVQPESQLLSVELENDLFFVLLTKEARAQTQHPQRCTAGVLAGFASISIAHYVAIRW